MSNEQIKDLDQYYEKSFTKYIKKIGPTTILIAALLSFMPAIYIGIRYDAFPKVGQVFDAWLAVASTFGAFYIVEPLSYFAVLGIAGTYLSFLSGNIGNMRVPAAALAQDVVGTEPGTKKAELVGIIAISGSIITNMVIMTIMAIAGQIILGLLPTLLVDALKYILPALFGGLIVFYGMKSIRSLFISLPIAILLMKVLHVKTIWVVTLTCIFVTMAINIYLYKKAKKG